MQGRVMDIKAKSPKQMEAEADVQEFADDLGPFVVAGDKTRMPMVFTDAATHKNPVIFANDAFLDLTGFLREEVLGQEFNFLMVDPDDKVALSKIQAEFRGEPGSTEIHYRRKDGSEFWASVLICPVRDRDEKIVQYFASFVDLTKHMDEESQMRSLIEELNHRVKNTLATVQSIVWQALRANKDPKQIADSIESRLFALSRSHDLLSEENWKSAGLVAVIENALEPFGVKNGRADRLIIQGEDYRVTPKLTLALSIVMNELATNAVKYGAFSNDTGSIDIRWDLASLPQEESGLTLRWEEKNGPPVTLPTRKGFGTRVLERGLAHELACSVNLDFRPEGFVCTIHLPAPNGALLG
jgi:PAS domain S-box-containing protein